MDLKNQPTNIPAVRTADGFIEIVSLTALDAIVGGLIAMDEATCEIASAEILVQPGYKAQL